MFLIKFYIMNNSTQLNVSKRTNQKRLYFFIDIVRYLNLTVSFVLYQISRIIFVNNFIKNFHSNSLWFKENIIHNKRTDWIELLTLHLQWTNWFNRIIQILIDNKQTDSIRSHYKYLSVKSVNERNGLRITNNMLIWDERRCCMSSAIELFTRRR